MEAQKVLLLVDNKSLIHAVKSLSPVEDKRLRINIASLQESIEKNEVEDICYVRSAENLANALTKRGASSKTLVEVLSGKRKFNYATNCFD